LCSKMYVLTKILSHWSYF